MAFEIITCYGLPLVVCFNLQPSFFSLVPYYDVFKDRDPTDPIGDSIIFFFTFFFVTQVAPPPPPVILILQSVNRVSEHEAYHWDWKHVNSQTFSSPMEVVPLEGDMAGLPVPGYWLCLLCGAFRGSVGPLFLSAAFSSSACPRPCTAEQVPSEE